MHITHTLLQQDLLTEWRMPAEGEAHRASWMAFGPDLSVWGQCRHAAMQDGLAAIAQAIAAYEPVHMLVRPEDYDVAARKCGPGVNLVVQAMDDLWLRDSGPVFVGNAEGRRAAVDFNFNGWGNKQPHAIDAQVAAAVCERAEASRIVTSLVMEGGGIEVDGQGTAIITESCVLNPNRNPGLSKAQCEAELQRLLGVRKIIWLPGIVGKEITDGHTDFYARFASPGVVLAGYDANPASFDHAVTLRHLDILRQACDADGRKLEVVVLQGPGSLRTKYQSTDFAAAYINFYVCNGAVIAPEFGDVHADRNARAILRELYPQREVIQLNIDAVAAGGGGIHCTTQQEPAAQPAGLASSAAIT